jgi:hypothetical protein
MGNLRRFLDGHYYDSKGKAVPLSKLNLTTDKKDFILKHLRKVNPDDYYNKLNPTGKNRPI